MDMQDAAGLTNTAKTFAEHFLTEPYADFDKARREGGTFGLSIIDVKQKAGEFTDPGLSEFAFVTSVAGAGRSSANFGEGWVNHASIPKQVDLQPAGTECRFALPDMHIRVVATPEHIIRSLLDELGLNVHSFDGVTNKFRHLPHASDLIAQMWYAASTTNAASNLIVDGVFLQLIGVLLEACGHRHGICPIASLGDTRLRRAVEYAETHLRCPLTVGELANIAGMSPSHFSRSFKTATGETVWQYVIRRRTERAREMLTRENASLSQAAFATGFSDASHLHRSLKTLKL